MNV
ncbi:hypothetical protein ECEC1848_4605, partial [Escherichia coli EC1848]|jgi:hypothetical protein